MRWPRERTGCTFNIGFKALSAGLLRPSNREKRVGVNTRVASARCRDSNDIRIATCPASFYRDGTYKVIRLTFASTQKEQRRATDGITDDVHGRAEGRKAQHIPTTQRDEPDDGAADEAAAVSAC
jgi:hypothetical protein